MIQQLQNTKNQSLVIHILDIYTEKKQKKDQKKTEDVLVNKPYRCGNIDQANVTKRQNQHISFLNIDENNNSAEISYIFDVDYTKKGYCSETCKKLIEIAFNELDLHKVYADTIEGNNNSKKVLEKLGFTLEGTRRDAAYIKEKNEYRNFLDYGLLKDEHKQNHCKSFRFIIK